MTNNRYNGKFSMNQTAETKNRYIAIEITWLSHPQVTDFCNRTFCPWIITNSTTNILVKRTQRLDVSNSSWLEANYMIYSLWQMLQHQWHLAIWSFKRLHLCIAFLLSELCYRLWTHFRRSSILIWPSQAPLAIMSLPRRLHLLLLRLKLARILWALTADQILLSRTLTPNWNVNIARIPTMTKQEPRRWLDLPQRKMYAKFS